MNFYMYMYFICLFVRIGWSDVDAHGARHFFLATIKFKANLVVLVFALQVHVVHEAVHLLAFCTSDRPDVDGVAGRV